MPADSSKRSRTVSITEFSEQGLALLDEVQRTGCEVLVVQDGRVVARLLPPEHLLPSALGWMEGTVRFDGDPTGSDDVGGLGDSV